MTDKQYFYMHCCILTVYFQFTSFSGNIMLTPVRNGFVIQGKYTVFIIIIPLL
jgi:hypothetical protein